MTEPTAFDPFSVLVQILGVLTGPSSLIVWIVVVANSIIGWVILGSRVARLSKEAADRIAAQRSRIPAFLVVAVIQILFLATGTLIAIQWGVVQQLDQSLDTPSFVEADFEIGRQSPVFWVIMLFNVAMLLIAWSDEFVLIIGGLGFLWFAVLVMLAVNHQPSAVAVHVIYALSATASLSLSRYLVVRSGE